MAPHERMNSGSIRGTILSMIFIMFGIVACAVTLVLGGDVYCRVDIDHWLPIYPDATLVDNNNRAFFRPRASGITSEVYYTEDDAATVRRWYSEYRREITRNTETGDRAARGLATTDYVINANPDGTGTFIQTYSECGYN